MQTRATNSFRGPFSRTTQVRVLSRTSYQGGGVNKNGVLYMDITVTHLLTWMLLYIS